MFESTRRSAALDEIAQMDMFASVAWFPTIDSTNKYLHRSLTGPTSVRLPALVVTDEQSAGVGRGSNAWWSQDGCLMFSMAVPVSCWNLNDLNADGQTAMAHSLQLPLRVGYAVAKTISQFTCGTVQVKWPNDVYLNDRKVSGVLIETLNTSDKGQVAIIGVGINCHVDLQRAPLEVRASAISLHEAKTDLSLEPISVEATLIGFLQTWKEISVLHLEDSAWLLREWPSVCWLRGEWVEVTQPKGLLQGQVEGIDERGALILRDFQGKRFHVLSGTVRKLLK